MPQIKGISKVEAIENWNVDILNTDRSEAADPADDKLKAMFD